jgi:hypothetical protein
MTCGLWFLRRTHSFDGGSRRVHRNRLPGGAIFGERLKDIRRPDAVPFPSNLIIQHVNGLFHTIRDQLTIKPEGLRRDVCWFCSLPIPQRTKRG